MSFNFVVNDMTALMNALRALGMVNETADAAFSPKIFSIMSDSNVSIHSAIGVQLWPSFFDRYVCDLYQHSWFFLTEIFPLVFDLQESGYNSFSFSITPNPDLAKIKFQGPNGLLREIDLELVYSHHPLCIGELDFSVFVCMDCQEFSNIVAEYHVFDYVHVNITSTRVRFSYSIVQETIVAAEEGKCIIGGIKAPIEVEFIVTLSPSEVFNHIANQTKCIWFFKEFNSNKGIITAPLGLNGRFVAFFCDVFEAYR